MDQSGAGCAGIRGPARSGARGRAECQNKRRGPPRRRRPGRRRSTCRSAPAPPGGCAGRSAWRARGPARRDPAGGPARPTRLWSPSRRAAAPGRGRAAPPPAPCWQGALTPLPAAR
eukprot:1672778-Pyramimonas_sp.AAC.1